MGFLDRLMRRETRSLPAAPVKASDPYLAEYFGLRGGGAMGRYASPDEAVATLAVAARCISLISEGLAALPLRAYRWTEDGGREIADTHPLDVLLNDVPNPSTSAFMLREGLVADVLTSGNGYLRQEIDARGRVSALHYLPRGTVGVERFVSGRLRYRVSEYGRTTFVLTQDEVVHLRYRTRDGVMGISPLQWAGLAVGLSVAQSELAQQQIDRGFVPDVSFETDAAFLAEGRSAPNDDNRSENAFKRLKEQLAERMRKKRTDPTLPLLLEGGLKANVLTTSGREAQFHEMRLRGMADVATLFGVPLSVLGLGTQASYGSLTEESRALVRDCYRPWARRIEGELIRSLLTREGRRSFTLAHDLSGLEDGDRAERFATYATAIQNEIYCPDECRIMEGRSRRPDGQGSKFRNPATTGTGDRFADPNAPTSPVPQGQQEEAQPAEA